MKSPALLCSVAISLALVRAGEAAPRNAQELWAGYNPRAEPLEIVVAKSWEEDVI